MFKEKKFNIFQVHAISDDAQNSASTDAVILALSVNEF